LLPKDLRSKIHNITRIKGAGDLNNVKSSNDPASSDIDGMSAILGIKLTMNLVVVIVLSSTDFF
jgi:hypothetical protein